MKWLENISIRNKLQCVGVTWIIVLICFGIFGIYQMQHMNDLINEIYHQPLQLSIVANQIRADTIKIHRGMKDMILPANIGQVQSRFGVISEMEEKVLTNLTTIQEQMVDQQGKEIEQSIRGIFLELKNDRWKTFDWMVSGNIVEAEHIVNNILASNVRELEARLDILDKYIKDEADALIVEANNIVWKQRTTLLLSMVIISISSLGIFAIILQSIVQPITVLKDAIITSAHSNEILEVHLSGQNELIDMANHYNILVKKLNGQFWSKDCLNQLNEYISRSHTVQDLTQQSIRFLSRVMDAGKGVFYLLDPNLQELHLNAAYAYTDTEESQERYQIGKGIIGQVAEEKKPILLTDINAIDSYIVAGTVRSIPVNTYTFPLMHEDVLYGVIELASFQPFTPLKQELLMEAAQILATNLCTVLQNQKIKDLLVISNEAQQKAENTAKKLQKNNQILERQQLLLQEQAAELQQSNAELEEKQQQLQQQSQELQSINVQLEEQQRQLEEQSRLLSVQNQSLEKSGKELADRSKQLEISSRYKTQFLTNMSHELRTPLNSIILLSKLLTRNESRGLSEKDIEKANIILRSGEELLRLINDILDLSKIEAGKINLENEVFHTRELLKELHQMFKNTAKSQQIKLISEDLIDDELVGDKDKIAQILRNFLSNGIKFTEKGYVHLKMIKNPSFENSVIFSVTDTGIGIAQEKIELIFEEFQQLDGSISRKYGGTGLGLAISKNLSDLMHGEIHVDSRPGEGSTFSLILYDMKREKRAVAEGDLQEIGKNANVQARSGNEKSILIIEDDLDFANIIQSINDKMGFHTYIAADGKTGLELVKLHEIDGIILDLGLPDISGIEVLRELKSTKELKNIPVHIISAMEQNEYIQSMDVVGYHQKPIEEKDIFNLIMKMIEKSSGNQGQNLEICEHPQRLDDITLFLHKVKNKVASYEATPRPLIENALSLENKKILMVDDDPTNIFVVATALENYGAEIHDAENGIKALKKLQQVKPDLILMDIMMPEMDGYEAIQKIRSTEEICDIPIIALTAKALKEDKEKCIAVGANDYISKPINYDTLIRLVNAWINK